ncbi:RNA-binding S1 domain-containing protein [Thermoclostridium stercorarium subsp. stercorarium DSM 8532]|uniref:RNA-binding S1 domain-containing protein n=3 Tax=Thermoclostridium stercorarium TaxID=1510 RepID=L7VVT6_THES1|nr:Tex family protein [Thermoclostridium stercorarium]AGC69638.1 RNA-binding S1 domain-containing protein [Thermoclostridium stercorarium subsp. stercorarium DSM 8532]AGI40590.1 transcriptional accessory protein [Thermoclostridium stercorarium subsp. stercorarium DSM 8532]ANW99862.1 RNA-binding transcriptional accessory protein [Thermoclostridium stercorarium subsp. thermolacticum DSM 2910]ANX02486.1 RNA-binding transcriptional accessory protein [Thermoclostridium stercorarium subsp. leptospart
MDIKAVLQKEFQLSKTQVENVINLIEAGNTIPFIARYRKEMTGSLNDQVLREFNERYSYLKNLEARKKDVYRLIEEQGKMTDEIAASIEGAMTLQEIEDIYRPFRPKRRTRAMIAKEKGLEPLASLMMLGNITDETIENKAREYINPEKGLNNVEEVLEGARDIVAEEISDNALVRKEIRNIFHLSGVVESVAVKEEDSVYRQYYDFKEPVKTIPSHRILAINRGEREEFLKVSISVPEDKVLAFLYESFGIKDRENRKHMAMAVEDAYKRLIRPSIEREIRNELTERAEEQAMSVFRENLRKLLMQPPVHNCVVLGIDPAYRTGCKICVVDETGKVLATGVVYPTPPQNRTEEAKAVLKELIEKYDVDVIAIGNGTASRETEIFVADMLKEIEKEVKYMVVNEAGASVYSASRLGAEEFPDFDVSLRSAVSIARRLQDPLAELVKIDPKSIGVGQYQHDMNQKRLSETLGAVVEDVVNKVGVDLNTASVSLLSYVSGISKSVAANIVAYREKVGKFRSREELKKVPKLGPKIFEQCAGFLRIRDGDNVLDNTAVHPESYDACELLLKKLGYTHEDIRNHDLDLIDLKIKEIGLKNLAEELNIGEPTLKDIIEELKKPGRDPRDELPPPMLRRDILDIKDLKPGMVLTGTVRNVADFGAFVDIGVHQDGLVHISQLSDKFVKNPLDVVSVGDIVTVKVLDVDIERKRISLTMRSV